MKSTWPTQCQRESIFQLLAFGVALGIIGSCWACQALRCVCQSLRWVRQAFWIYRQCESLALGVLPNAKPQREGVCIVVEYRFKVHAHSDGDMALSDIRHAAYISMTNTITNAFRSNNQMFHLFFVIKITYPGPTLFEAMQINCL